MPKRQRGLQRQGARPGRSAPPAPTSFAEAWSVLRSSSSSREQRGRLMRMFGAALILVVTAGVTVVAPHV